MNSSLRRARLLVLCGPLALGILFSPLTGTRAFAQDAPVAAPEAPPVDAATAPETAATAPANANAWTTLRGDVQRTGSSNAQVSLPLSLDWRYSSEAPAGSYSASPLVLGAPGAQRVYFAVGRQVICVDAQTGAPASNWKVPSLSSSISAPLTLLSTDDGDFVVAASQGGAVSAFRTGDGGRQWEAQIDSGVSSGGPIVVKTNAGTRVVVATDSGKLVAITTAGVVDPKWRVPLGRFGNPPSSAMALSQDGSILCVVATDGKMYGIDVKLGRVAWGATLPNATSVTPVVADKRVITAGLARIASYEASGGINVWSVPSRGTVTAPPAYRVVDEVPTLFYGTNEGNFYALDARDGSQQWKATGVGNFTGAPVVLNNMVIAGTRTGSLVAMNPQSGVVLWQYRLKTERLLNNGRGRGGGAGGDGGGRGGGRGGFRGGSFDTGTTGAQIQLVQDEGDDPRGGGRGGGGRGGFGGGGGRAQTQQFSSPYSITAPPAVVNGQVFVQGNDAAIYSFTSQTIDADPPRVVEPSISVPDDKDNLTALLVGGENPPIVPGRGPFYFAAQIDDVGSGINAKTLQVSLDGTPVDPKNVDFDATSGILTVTLIDPAKGGTSFADGSKSLNIIALDYAGNTLSSQFDFMVDNTVNPPKSRPTRGGNRGRGGGDPNDPNTNADPTEPEGGNLGGGDEGDGGDGGRGFDGADGGRGFDGGRGGDQNGGGRGDGGGDRGDGGDGGDIGDNGGQG